MNTERLRPQIEWKFVTGLQKAADDAFLLLGWASAIWVLWVLTHHLNV